MEITSVSDLMSWLAEEIEVAGIGGAPFDRPRQLSRLGVIQIAAETKRQIEQFKAAIENPYETGGYKATVVELMEKFGVPVEYFGTGKDANGEKEKKTRLDVDQKVVEVLGLTGKRPRITFTRRESLDRMELLKAGVTAEQIKAATKVKYQQELRWVEGEEKEAEKAEKGDLPVKGDLS